MSREEKLTYLLLKGWRVLRSSGGVEDDRVRERVIFENQHMFPHVDLNDFPGPLLYFGDRIPADVLAFHSLSVAYKEEVGDHAD